MVCSPRVWAAQSCERHIAGVNHVIAGMFRREPGAVLEVTGFPLIGSGRRLAYAHCPVTDVDGLEMVMCNAGVLERQGSVLLPAEPFGLEGCTAGKEQGKDCPDFTAEGFSFNNAGQLAALLKRNRHRLCARFGKEPVVALASVPTPGKGEQGLDGGTFFEIMPSCAALGADADARCAAALQAAQGKAAGVTWVTAGSVRMVCAVAFNGALLACAMPSQGAGPQPGAAQGG